jgi:hypothetical protein
MKDFKGERYMVKSCEVIQGQVIMRDKLRSRTR